MSDPLLDPAEFQALDVIEYFEFLDDLREEGSVNMFGAAPYLERECRELDIHEARKVLSAWQKTFDRDLSAEDRAYKALGDDA
jgi:hypothetical protein